MSSCFYKKEDQFYCPCLGIHDARFPEISITIQNNEFVFLPEHYLKYEPSARACWVTITKEDSDSWLLGDNFLRAYY